MNYEDIPVPRKVSSYIRMGKIGKLEKYHRSENLPLLFLHII
jgi:hypothetical protein